MNIITNFEKIKQEIKNDSIRKNVEIVAVSKTFSLDHVMPLLIMVIDILEKIKFKKLKKKWNDLKN